MDKTLQVGDVFTSSKMDGMMFGYVVHDSETGEPYVDFSTLHTADYGDEVQIIWTEYAAEGWERKRKITLSTKVKDPKLFGAEWKVIETSFCGGGAGHGPYDIYPDGHHVKAKRVNGKETISFYQNGCFRGMLDPKDITKV
jgi:hypothetical protein